LLCEQIERFFECLALLGAIVCGHLTGSP
jgi:hypothetical protein